MIEAPQGSNFCADGVAAQAWIFRHRRHATRSWGEEVEAWSCYEVVWRTRIESRAAHPTQLSQHNEPALYRAVDRGMPAREQLTRT